MNCNMATANDNLTLDQAEERAAIREYCGGMTREEAEKQTAQDCGYSDWEGLKKGIK